MCEKSTVRDESQTQPGGRREAPLHGSHTGARHGKRQQKSAKDTLLIEWPKALYATKPPHCQTAILMRSPIVRGQLGKSAHRSQRRARGRCRVGAGSARHAPEDRAEGDLCRGVIGRGRREGGHSCGRSCVRIGGGVAAAPAARRDPQIDARVRDVHPLLLRGAGASPRRGGHTRATFALALHAICRPALYASRKTSAPRPTIRAGTWGAWTGHPCLRARARCPWQAAAVSPPSGERLLRGLRTLICVHE